MARRSKERAMVERIAELFPPEEVLNSAGNSASHSELVKPTSRFRWRWTVGTTAAAVTVTVAALIACLVWWSGNSSASTSLASPMRASASTEVSVPAPGSSGTTSASSGQQLIVHLIGAVVKPGIITLPVGSRVFQAIEAAGGATTSAVLSAVNLAAVLDDGAQVFVPTQAQLDANQVPQATVGPGGGSSNALPGKAPAGKVNLNSASPEQLALLPRVGPKMAQKIVEWRAQHGKFSSIDDLDAIDGIGPKLLEALRPLVTI